MSEKASERIARDLRKRLAEFETAEVVTTDTQGQTNAMVIIGAVIADEIQEGVEQLKRIADALGKADEATAHGVVPLNERIP